MVQEIWKRCTEGPWEVSNYGHMRYTERVGSGAATRHAGDPIKFYPNRIGYLYTVRKYRRKVIGIFLHQYVARYFIGERPVGKVVCHEDNNKTNCAIWNLRYDTQKQNNLDALRDGLFLNRSKITKDDAVRIKSLRGTVNAATLAAEYGTSIKSIYRVWSGERKYYA